MNGEDAQPSGAPEGADPMIGAVLGERYRVLSLLGVGGMGAVYFGEHVKLPRRVAIKVLHAELSGLAEARGRFENEARAAAVLDHPNVVTVTDFGDTDDGHFYLVMEYIEGVTLRAAIDAAGALTLTRLANLARQLGAALERAHSLGIVHRDLKPENIMLIPGEDGGELVKVVDFGIAKLPREQRSATGSVQTRVGLVYGTFEYMPPEQALGEEVSASADIYALGVILFEALTGRRPFEDESAAALLSRQLSEAVPSASERRPDLAPREVDRVLGAMMAKLPAARPPSVRVAVDAFLLAIQRPSVMAGPPGAISPGPSPRASTAQGGGSLRTVALLVAVGAGATLLGALGWVRRAKPPASATAADRAVEAPPREAAVTVVPNAPTARADAGAQWTARERARRYLSLPQTQDGFRLARRGQYPAVSRSFEAVWRQSADVTIAYALGLLAAEGERHDASVRWFSIVLRDDPSFIEEDKLVDAVVRAFTEGAPAAGSEAMLLGALRARALPRLRAAAQRGATAVIRARAARILASPAMRQGEAPQAP